MDPTLSELLNLTLRWLHLIAAIAWIGSSFFFVWLDEHFLPPETPRKNVDGELWMVHSGAFYQVEKRKIGPGDMPKILHWFKWEAAFTLLTGLSLFILIYYMTRGIYLVDPSVSNITAGQATALGTTLFVVSWFVYDFLWQSRLAKDGRVATGISLMLLLALIYLLCHTLAGRAAFIHTGAILGTIMVLNVWVRILPAQQQMIDATDRGEMPDLTLGKNAKRRSMHNSYMTLPVIFMMLSNHYAPLYGAELNWVVLILLVVIGAGARHFEIIKSWSAAWVFIPVTASVVAVFILARPPSGDESVYVSAGSAVPYSKVQEIISNRCLRCHSENPTDEQFLVAPAGITFDTPELVEAYADLIKIRAVDTKTMPLNNKTKITPEERVLLGRWVEAGGFAD